MTYSLVTSADQPRWPDGSKVMGLAVDREKNARLDAASDGNDPLAGRRNQQNALYRVLFEHDPTPRFILDGDSRIVEANAEGRSLITRGVVGAGGMLLCSAHRDRPRLIHAVKRVSQSWQATCRVLVRGQDDAWCLIELLGAEELNGHVVAAMRRTTELTPDRIEPLKAVFGLTPVETQVLTHIAGGEAPKEVARALSISIFTVRAHLRTIFVKLGVRGTSGMLRLTLQLAL